MPHRLANNMYLKQANTRGQAGRSGDTLGVSLEIGNFLFEIVSHLLDHIFFDLPHPLTGYTIFVADLLQRQRAVGKDPLVKYLQFPVGHLGSEFGDFFIEQG